MDATSRARWRRVATVVGLVCVAAQLCAVAGLPAPPTATGAQLFLDIATPPPITEDELHNMVEQLLMEAYGDEYEPPPSRPKNKTTRETTPSIITSSTSAPSGSPRSKSASDDDIAETLLILQQQEKLIQIQKQREKLHQMQKQLHVEQRQQQEQQQHMFIQSTNIPPITKGSLILHQQLTESPTNLPTSVPTLDKPRVLHGQNTDASNLTHATRPPVSVQPPETTMSKPRGIPSPDELQKAMVFQQENQPGVLIVDRRKKSKTEKSKEPFEGGNLASRNGRSPQRNSAKPEQQAERKPPVIESAKLISHIASEDMQPFHQVQSSTKQMVSGSAPRPFTLPSPVNNPNPIKIQPVQQEEQKALNVDIADEDLMMLQLLGSQLSQAARVQSTQNLVPSQPQSSGQASLNNQPGNLQFVMQPKRHNDENRIVINLGNMANQLQSTSVPLQMNAGSNDNFIRSFRDNDQAKAISSGNRFQDFSSSTQMLHPVNQNSNGRVTVGDLVMSLNGQNGIRVVSLGDLRNNGGSSVSNNDAHLLQQLRNAMISGNINTLQNQQLNFGVALPSLNQGSQHSNHGVPLPTLVNQNQQGFNGVSSGNAGRQFDFLFGNENQNSQNTVDFNGGGGNGGSGVINDLLFDSSISIGRPGDSIPQTGGAGSLDDFFVNANSGSGAVTGNGFSSSGAGDLDDIFRSSDTSSSSTGSVGVPLPAATAQDPLPDTFTATSDTATTATTALGDNTDFDFGSYEDDFPDLPPQPPNVFRTGISDIFFTKGQWIGTLLGGLFDVGSAVGSSVSKLFKKGSREMTTTAST